MVFDRSLSDSKSPQVSRTLLSILANLNNEFGWLRLVLRFSTLLALFPNILGLFQVFQFVVVIIIIYSPIGIMVSVRRWPRRPGFNPRSSHANDPKVVLEASLINTQLYNVRNKGKWINPGKRKSSAFLQHFCVVAIEKELSGHPRLRSTNLCFNDGLLRKNWGLSGKQGVSWERNTSEHFLSMGAVIFFFSVFTSKWLYLM